MSIMYCDKCDQLIDTDFDAEHIKDCPENKKVDKSKLKKVK